MLKIFIGVVIVVLVALGAGGAYYVGSIKTEEKLKAEAAAISGYPAPSEFATTTRPAAYVEIAINKGHFDPATVTIKKGTEVVWINKDAVTHTVTSDEGGLILNSQAIAAGHSFAHIFNEPGTITYHCAIDRAMTSTVIVEE